MIRKATEEDIESILEITKLCAKHMINQGVFQWNEQYPNREVFKNDVKNNELYVLEKESKIVGCIVISSTMDEEYIPIGWLTPSDKNIYIHRLAVHPLLQGNGFAQDLMFFAERFAREKGFTSIRLDTFSQNHRNQKFYELRGYQKLGSVYFPKQSKNPFFCYELVL